MGISGRAPAAGGRAFHTSTPTGPRAPRGSPPRRRLTVAANGGGNIDDRQAIRLTDVPHFSRSIWPPTSGGVGRAVGAVSYTHLRAHETRHDLVCRLLLEK